MTDSKDIFINLLNAILSEQEALNQILFAGDHEAPPTNTYQVNFPRLDIVFKGMYENTIENHYQEIETIPLMMGDALFIQSNAWNKPNWENECSVLSILFGKNQLGLSLVSKKSQPQNVFDVVKHSVPLRTGQALDDILNALSRLAYEKNKQPMDKFLILALLSNCREIINCPLENSQRRSQDIFKSICIYVQKNFHKNINRNMVAIHFNISPNHLSRIFRQEGHMRFADYIAWVRLERAKFMLKRYSFRLEEIAHRCGYEDTNYFCRVFKRKTGRTPTEYRLN